MRRLLLLLAPLVLAACPAPEDTPHPRPGADPRTLLRDGGSWTVTAAEGRAMPEGVTLRREGDQVSGQAACNLYSGTVDVAATTLRIRDVNSTLMACVESGRMAADGAFFNALARVDGARGDPGGTVSLTAGGRTVLTLQPAPGAAG